MKLITRILIICWMSVWYGFAAATVLVAAVFSLARLLLPMMGDYSVTVEEYFTQIVDQPIKIQSLDAEWHGVTPSLVLNNVRLLDQQGKNTIVRLSKARLGFGWWETLQVGQLSFSSLDLIGVDLSLVRQENGRIGLLGFELGGNVESDVVDEAFLSNWLLGQGRIGLEIRNVFYDDRMERGRKYHFSNVELTLRNDGERHLIDGYVAVPNQPNQKMSLAIEVNGNLLEYGQWSGSMYVSGNQINIIDLASSLTPMTNNFEVGASDFEIWSQWQDSRLQKLQGEFVLRDVLLHKSVSSNASAESALAPINKYDSVNARLAWRSNANGWEFNADNVTLHRDQFKWPLSQVSVSYNNDAGSGVLSGAGSFIRVQDLTPFLQLFAIENNKVTELIHATKVKGEVKDYQFRWSLGQPQEYFLSATVEQLALLPYGKLPGITGMDARMEMDKHHGKMTIQSSDMVLDLPQMLRQAIALDNIQAEVAWQQDERNLYVNARQLSLRNRDITSRMLVDMEIPKDGGAPFISLVGKFNSADGSNAPKYLPAKIMSANAVSWLDRAIVEGRVPNGGVIFHGKTSDFPFDKGNGIFEVKFDVKEGTLDYAKNWPRMENVSAEITFRGKSLVINADRGTIFQSRLDNTFVQIPNLRAKPLLLNVNGDVHGATQEKIDYMLSTPPLYKKFAPFFEKVSVTGDSLLHLNINFELEKGEVNSEVSGWVQFKDNNISTDMFGELFEAAQGKVVILPYGVQAKEIKTKLYGQTSFIDVDMVLNKSNKKPEAVKIAAVGQFDTKNLSKQYLPVLTDLVSGHSHWKVAMNVPVEEAKHDINSLTKPVTLVAESMLKGVEVRLPTPFDKKSEQRLKTKIEAELFPGRKYMVRAHYGNRFDGVFEYSQEGEDALRGELRFGGGEVSLPDGEGFRLVGQLQKLSVDVWRSLITQAHDSIDDSGVSQRVYRKSIDFSKYFHSADLNIDHFQIYGQDAKNMHFELKKNAQELIANVNSDELRGVIKVPHDLDRNPLVFDLDRWELTSSSAAGQTIDPRNLPSIKAFAKSVSYKKRKFGSVKLVTTKLVEGLRLEQLVLNPRSTTISAFGEWMVSGGQHYSDFELHLDSKNLGETMDDLNYLGSISGGEGKIDASISWPGALTDVELEQLQGNVSIRFTDGKLLAVDSGAGRIFGLFSLQTLPKRLLLDFSDIYSKGIVFNTIEGNFTIDGGDAYTNNFYMDGPGAKARAAGRIGLASQDYDQLLTFIPQTADIASIIGLVVSAPWGFVIPQIFKENINQAMSFQYTLTGDWDNPILDPVIKYEAEDFLDE